MMLCGEANSFRAGYGGSMREALSVLMLCLMLPGCATPVSVYGLKPEYPEVRRNATNAEIAFVEVDSLTPTLKWETFPRGVDREAGYAAGRIANVTYDLQIWQETGERGRAVLVYEKNGLTAASHRVEMPLWSSTRYLWSVRARFELDGKPRVTEWGRPQKPDTRRSNEIPNFNLYRFQTPAE